MNKSLLNDTVKPSLTEKEELNTYDLNESLVPDCSCYVRFSHGCMREHLNRDYGFTSPILQQPLIYLQEQRSFQSGAASDSPRF